MEMEKTEMLATTPLARVSVCFRLSHCARGVLRTSFVKQSKIHAEQVRMKKRNTFSLEVV